MMKTVSAVIVAAGNGSRMGTKTKKQYLMLEGMPVLAHTIRAYEESAVEEIILVVGRGEEEYVIRDIVKEFGYTKVAAVVAGGATRAESVYEGIKAVSGETVLVHDGARPFIRKKTIGEAILCAQNRGACIVACPAVDTVKIADESGVVTDTPDRSRVWTVQTPQAFRTELLKGAYEAMWADEGAPQVTDDSMVVETYTDSQVFIVPGEDDNIKITTPKDMLLGKEILRTREKEEE